MGGKRKHASSNSSSKEGNRNRKKNESIVRKAHQSGRKDKSYMNGDETFSSWKIQLNKLGLQIRDIEGDGNCLFRALSDQMTGNTSSHQVYRHQVCDYMIEHEQDFAPFVEEDLPFPRYISNLRKDGTYAGNDVIVAFSRIHNVSIVIHHLDAPAFRIDADKCEGELHLSYHNEEHYSSVRRLGDKSTSSANIKMSKTQSKPHTSQQHPPSISHSGHTRKPDSEDEIITLSQITDCQDLELVREAYFDFEGNIEQAADYIRSIILAVESIPGDSASEEPRLDIQSDETTCKLEPDQSEASTTKQQTTRQTKSARKVAKKQRAMERRKAELQARNSDPDNQLNDDGQQELYQISAQLAVLNV